MNFQPRRSASSSPMVFLPEPDTPITRTITGPSLPFRDGVASEALSHHGEELPRVVRAALAGEAAHESEGNHRRRHAELDRLQRGPASLAGVGDDRRDIRQVFISLENFRS